jgi:hypothetical protein
LGHDVATNFEKYLAGEPLNEELAALKAGRLPEFELRENASLTQAAGSESFGDDEKPLTRDECVALREMRTSAGWPVMQKLIRKTTLAQKKAAMLISEQDPLGAGRELANAWLEVKVWKQLTAQLIWLITIAIESLEDDHSVNRAELKLNDHSAS